MKVYDDNKPLISIHIPKCAGTSFSMILKQWFKRNYLCHYFNEKKNKPPRKHKLEQGFFLKRYGLCIHGHFNNNRGIGVDDYYPEVNQFITVIRDPFDLHLSTYFFVKSQSMINRHGALRSGKLHPIISNKWNLEQFLENNKQSYIRNFLPPEITQDNFERILSDKFIYIGVTEELQNSIDNLARILGFDSVLVTEKNVSDWKEEIPNGAREEFEQNNKLEFAIYKYAKANLNSW